MTGEPGPAKAAADAGEVERLPLVDDNPTNLHVLFQTRDGLGHELLVARSGEEALALAREARPSLILLVRGHGGEQLGDDRPSVAAEWAAGEGWASRAG